jgi:VWFA-related protein
MRCAVFTVLLAAGTVRAQTPEAVFKATTKLVEVSVIAQDKDGKPVADLRREEFQIFDDGSPQEIRVFLADAASATEPAPPPAPGTFTNQISSSGGLRSGYAVLLFDNNTTGFEHTARARLKALQALRAIPAGDKIAIYSLWCQFQVIREFTADRESLLRQLQAFAPAAGSCGSGGGGDGPLLANRPLSMQEIVAPEAAIARARAAAEAARVGAIQQASFNDEEIKAMANHLAGIPGRKNLIWLATNFQISPPALRKLIDAGVAVYPVDAIGSMIATAAEKEARSAPLRALAAITGGVAYFDRDDLDVAVRDALDDGRVSYTLGFYQTGDDTKAAVHQLGVRISRPGIKLRYRTSYETEPRRPMSVDPVADMVQAMNGPVDATAIAITASVTRLATRTQNQLAVSARFDAASLDLAIDQGLWKGTAEVVARFMAADGTQAGDTLAETVTLNLRPATYEAFLVGGLPYQKELTIPAKAVELKLLIGNPASGKIGTLTIPLAEIKEGAANAK